MLRREDTLLLVVDVQERLLPHIDRHEEVARSVEKLIRGAQILSVPVMVTEQYTKGLGPTVEPLRDACESFSPIEKITFSCCGEPSITDAIDRSDRKDILLCGIETHVCVYQTACDLLAAGKRVHLVTDSVSSRTKANRKLAIDKMAALGASLTSVEMVLFELLERAGTDEFKQVSRLVK